MGASLAIQWAAACGGDVRAVVAFDAPLFATRAEAEDRVRHMGWFEALLSTGPLAHRVCEWMCRHRSAASVLAVALNPTMPPAITRDGVRHTWFSYIQSFDALVAADAWVAAVAVLAERGIPLLLVDGETDPVPVPGAIAIAGGRTVLMGTRSTGDGATVSSVPAQGRARTDGH